MAIRLLGNTSGAAATLLLVGLFAASALQADPGVDGFEGPEPPVAFGLLPDARLDTNSVDHVDYDILIRLEPPRHYLEGTTRIVFRSRVSRLGQLDLVLYNDTLRILSVMHGTQELPWNYNPSTWVLSVGLSETLGPGDEDTVAVEYSGYITPALSSSLNNYCRLDAALGFSILPYVWYPAPYDHYFAGRRDDKFTCRTAVTVPRSWRAVGVGALSDSGSTDSLETYTWQTARPVRAAVFAVARYLLSSRVFDGLTVRYYDFDTSSAATTFQAVRSILNYLTRSFGPCSLEKLAYAENYQVYGAAAHSVVMMPLPYRLFGFVHETAHQWWGASLTLRYAAEVWLNEGFASYSEVLFQEDSLGPYVRWAELDTMARRYRNVPQTQDRPIIPAPTGSNYYFTIVYNKGAWVLHMLRWVLGDSAFFRAMNTYATTNRDSSVTVAAFREVAEQVGGEVLDWFFDEWLYHAGYPKYHLSWSTAPAGDSFRVITSLAQTNGASAPDCFQTPLPVRLSVPGPDTTIVIRPIANPQVDTFLVGGNPSGLTVDPDDWILDSSYVVHTGLEESEMSEVTGGKRLPSIIRGVLETSRQLTAYSSQPEFDLLDICGRKVMELQPGPNDVSRLAPGVYFIRGQAIEDNGPGKACRIVIQR
jgi:hypothetical protein